MNNKSINKPENIIYGVDEIPPLRILILQSLQHIFTLSGTFVLPVVIAQQLGYEFFMIRNYLAISMVACGIGTILQVIKKGRIGSGYFVPNLCGPTFIAVTIRAGWIGGLPLMSGMTIVAGFFELIFSFVINKIKFLFPASIVGLVVVMVGVALIPLGVSKFTGVDFIGDPIRSDHLTVSVITLLCMVILSFNGRGFLKLNCILIGMILGYILSFLFGIISILDIDNLLRTPLFLLPTINSSLMDFSFDYSLILPFAIVAVCAGLKSTGNITTAQRINDKTWEKPDMKNIGKGLLADSFGIITAGLLGGMACDTSASNVGITFATGVTSRIIGYFTGIILILVSFFPKFAAAFAIMPPPVVGAILIFVVCFMITSGLQIIFSEKMDMKTIFIIGIAFAFGLSADIMPEVYASVPLAIQPIFRSSLILSTVIAISLNLILTVAEKNYGLTKK